MDKPSGRILKANDVRIQGCFHLDVGQPVQKSGNVVKTASPQVCIVETNADYAIIEITCNCGTKTRIRCEYGDNKIN